MEDKKKLTRDIDIVKEMRTSFIDYAMSVIVSRAIPDARDGLKPVHRRILFAMSTLDLQYNKSHKKSARVVGDVIGKYHPHGDSSVYEAMVRMAQPFSMRYMLVDGQGNFGTVDGDSAAAMRYTEARMQKVTNLLLKDIKKNTVSFQENYDGSEMEPTVLPGLFPNLLANGTTGIAVGMATSIPPHNLNEIIDAAIAFTHSEAVTNEELSEIVKAPDFPTGGVLVNPSEMKGIYETGRGRAIVRSKVDINFDENKNQGTLIVSEIPYMVNKEQLVKKISELSRDKVIDTVADVSDESSRNGMRIVIKLKKGIIPEVALNELYKLTQLQSSFPINLLALVNGRPETLTLKRAIEVYVNHQINVLLRKTQFELDKAEARVHILEGLRIALDNIDEVIEIIKGSKDNQEANTQLANKYKLTPTQTKAILEMRLNRLTGLERENLIKEISELNIQIDDHKLVLSSSDVQYERLRDLLEDMKEEFGDDRRTIISKVDLSRIDDEDLIPEEEVVITISNNGYIKRMPLDEFRVQNRGGTGSRGASTNDDDFIGDILVASTHTDLLFFTSFGKVFKIRAHKIPQLGKTAKGLPIINLIQIEEGEQVKGVLPINDYESTDIVFVTVNGLIKKTAASEFKRVNRNGKKAIILKDGDELYGTRVVDDEQATIVIGNSNGKAIKFKLMDVRRSGRSSSGVKAIELDGGRVVDIGISTNGDRVFALSEKGFGKLTPLSEYRLTHRGGKGVITMNTKSAGKLVALGVVWGDEDIIVVTDKGTTIRTDLSQVSEYSRNTKGMKIIKLRDGETIMSKTIVKGEREIDSEIERTREMEMHKND